MKKILVILALVLVSAAVADAGLFRARRLLRLSRNCELCPPAAQLPSPQLPVMGSTEAQKKELIDKVRRLVANRFNGEHKTAFAHYDSDKNGKIDRSELMALLADAGIGNRLTRGSWASGVIEELDSDRDGAITLAELLKRIEP